MYNSSTEEGETSNPSQDDSSQDDTLEVNRGKGRNGKTPEKLSTEESDGEKELRLELVPDNCKDDLKTVIEERVKRSARKNSNPVEQVVRDINKAVENCYPLDKDAPLKVSVATDTDDVPVDQELFALRRTLKQVVTRVVEKTTGVVIPTLKDEKENDRQFDVSNVKLPTRERPSLQQIMETVGKVPLAPVTVTVKTRKALEVQESLSDEYGKLMLHMDENKTRETNDSLLKLNVKASSGRHRLVQIESDAVRELTRDVKSAAVVFGLAVGSLINKQKPTENAFKKLGESIASGTEDLLKKGFMSRDQMEKMVKTLESLSIKLGDCKGGWRTGMSRNRAHSKYFKVLICV